ncbi:MAG: class I SAM-dependent methyltransferase [Hyphomonadaceae bacterium]
MSITDPSQTISAPEDVIETIQVADIIASWKSDFGIDVAHLFAGVDGLNVVQDPMTGRLGFYPPIEGDAGFYQALRKFDWYHPPHKEEFAAAAAWHQAGEPVLDIGAGDADFSNYIPHQDYRGLELDGAAVAKAKASRLDVRDLSMRDYLASKEFAPAGLVAAFQVLEHVADPDGFISDMAAMTRTGGRVAIGVPDAGSYVADLPDFMLNAPPHHLTWWTEAALEAAMMRAGFEIEAVYRFAVEPWERQLWWMAKLAKLGRGDQAARFGAELRARKVASYIGSWVLQILPIPKTVRGSTLLMIGKV